MVDEKKVDQQLNKDEQIGFHIGSLSTLQKERQELLRINTIVEQLMQVHAKALQELGVDLQKKLGQPQPQKGNSQKPKGKGGKPIEDLL